MGSPAVAASEAGASEAGAGVLGAHASATRPPQKDGALGLGLFTNWPCHLSGRMTSEVTRKRSQERKNGDPPPTASIPTCRPPSTSSELVPGWGLTFPSLTLGCKKCLFGKLRVRLI